MDHYRQDRISHEVAGSYDDALDCAANGLADSITGALTDGLSLALNDPLVRTLMAADRVEPAALETMLRQVASRLGGCRSGGLGLCAR